jgi:hypothetical protein
MFIEFYKVSEQAREDFGEICPISIEKIKKKTQNVDDFKIEVNRKIRKMTNLGKTIEIKNDIVVKQYFDILILIRNYVVEYIEKTTLIEPYEISEEDKSKYDYIEEKLTKSKE